jgi:hypothetical protein
LGVGGGGFNESADWRDTTEITNGGGKLRVTVTFEKKSWETRLGNDRMGGASMVRRRHRRLGHSQNDGPRDSLVNPS